MENEKEIVQKRIERMQRKVSSAKRNADQVTFNMKILEFWYTYSNQKIRFLICASLKHFKTEINLTFTKYQYVVFHKHIKYYFLT